MDEPIMGMMKLSVTTMPWGKLKTESEFKQTLSSIKEIGFDGVGIEFRLLPKQLMDEPEVLPGILADVGLENGGTYSPTRIRELRWARRSKTPLLWVSAKEKDFKTALRRLRGFSRISKKWGIITALHNELRSSVETQPQIMTALESIGDLKLCLDTAHGEGANVNTIEMIQKYSDRLALVHLKDLRAKVPKSKVRFRRDFVNVGEGVVNLKQIIEKLDEIGYAGQLMLEIEALEDREPTSVVREGFEHISSMMNKVR
jgi:sugar phosphate isomerase/epimerase